MPNDHNDKFEFEIYHKGFFAKFLLILGFPTISYFFIDHFMKEMYFSASLLLVMLLILTALFLTLRSPADEKKKYLRYRIFLPSFISLFGIYLIYAIGVEGLFFKIYWSYLIPVLVFFAMGAKVGLLWTSIFFAAIAMIIFFSDFQPVSIDSLKLRFLITFFFVSVIAYLLGRLMLRNQQAVLNKQKALKHEIEEREIAKEALRTSEQRYRALAETAQDFIFIVDRDGNIQYVNDSCAKEFGCLPGNITGGNIKNFFPPEISSRQLKHVQSVFESGKPLNLETETTFPNRKLWLDTQLIPLKDESDNITSVLGISRDITERKRAEEEIKHTLSLLNATLESTADGILVVDREGKIESFNRKFVRMWQIPESIIESRDDDQALAFVLDQLKDPQVFLAKVKELYNQPAAESFDLIEFKDGRVFERYSQSQWIGEQSVGRVWSFRDVTERKRVEEALRESEERYRTILENIEDGYYETDLPGNLTFFNDSLCRILGYTRDEMMGMPNKQYTDEENRKKLYQAFNEVYRTGKPAKGFDWQVFTKDGRKLFGEVSVSLIRDSKGQPIGFRGIARDITERKQAEEALRAEKQKFETFLENAPFGLIVIDQQGIFEYVNSKFVELFGYDSNEIPNGREWFRKAYPDPDYRHHVIEAWIQDTNISAPRENVPRIFTATCKDGTQKIIRFITVKLGTGEYLMSCEDITLVQRAEEEKAVLAEQLRQSQKMEAIGRLAGGIAHDFNNLLTVIRGYSQLSLLELKTDDKLRQNIEEVTRATQRASDLTHHLLAFSRRQIMEMKILNLNTLLKDLDKMLHRVIGEDIQLTYLLSDELGKIRVDPGQMEQVILNLAVNARDAMPSGGKLTIETSNAELDETYAHTHIGTKPGRYVMMSVSDTGMGMTPEVRERAFDPFFTTKEKGKGTGLGLSTCYGIVKQSGGNIWAYSEPGRGTTIKIYLPRVDGSLEEPKEPGEAAEILKGTETILAVEDEIKVRKLVAQVLLSQGYTVMEASDGKDALKVARENTERKIDLLLTDVVMPGMSGRELAKALGLRHPKMKVLYMSGYTDNAIVHHGVLEEGVNYIQKPFTLDALARKVREILDRKG